MSLEKWLSQTPKPESLKPEEAQAERGQYRETIQKLLAADSSPFDEFFPVYQELLPLFINITKEEQTGLAREEQLAFARRRAAQLTITFGDVRSVIEYLRRFENQANEERKLLHDACLFNLPQGEKWDLKTWQALVNNVKPNQPNDAVLKILGSASKIEQYVKQNEQQIKSTLRNTIKPQLMSEYEQQYSIEYDSLRRDPEQVRDKYVAERLQEQEKSIQSQIEKVFDPYIKEQLGVPVRAAPTVEQKNAISARKKNPTAEDREFLNKTEQQVREDFKKRAENTYKTKGVLDHANKSKAEYVKEKLQKAAKTIDAIVEDKVTAQTFSPTMPMSNLFTYASNITYKNVSKNSEAAKLFCEYHLSQFIFDMYLSLVPKDDPDQIPNVRIEGAELSERYKDLYIMKLAPTDPRMAILGKLTSCCQSLGQEGQDPTIHAITSQYGGAYVLCRKNRYQADKPDTIVAQCWAWRATDGSLVFDSIESQIDFRKHNQAKIVDMFTVLASRLTSRYNISRVTVGQGGSTPHQMGLSMKEREEAEPIDYRGYRDSREQKIVATKKLPLLPYIHLSKNTQYEYKDPITFKEIEQILEYCIDNHLPRDPYILIPLIKKEDYERHRYGFASGLMEIIDNPNKFISSEMTLLHLVSQTGDMRLAKWLIDHGADVNLKSKHSPAKTALVMAAQDGNWEVFNLLLASGANFEDPQDQTEILVAACEFGKLPIVKNLVEQHQANIDLFSANGKSPLSAACGSKNLEIINWLRAHAARENPIDAKGRNLLHAFVTAGLTDQYKDLLQKGYDPNFRDNAGNTAIHFAASNYDLDAMKILTSYKADLLAVNYQGENVLDFIINSYRVSSDKILEIVGELNKQIPLTRGNLQALLHIFGLDKTQLEEALSQGKLPPKGQNEGIMLLAVKNNFLSLVKRCIDIGTDLNAVDDQGKTLLHYLAEANRWEEAFDVIARGANVNSADNQGNTALSIAVKQGSQDIMQRLIAVGAAKTYVSQQGKTLLHHAHALGNLDEVENALASGVEINAKDDQGQTALFSAVKKKDFALAKLLIAKGADLSVVSKNGSTLLHLIAGSDPKFVELIPQIISKGVAVDLKNEDGNGALHLAAYSGNEAALKALLQNGAKINDQGEGGATPLMNAASSGHRNSCSLLLEGGASLTIVDSHGNNILMYALRTKNEDIIKLFVGDPATINHQDKEGLTPIAKAINRGDFKSVQLLIKSGADLSVLDKQGNNLLLLAVRSYDELPDRWKIATLLLSLGVDPTEENDFKDSVKRSLGYNFLFDVPEEFRDAVNKWKPQNKYQPVFFKERVEEKKEIPPGSSSAPTPGTK